MKTLLLCLALLLCSCSNTLSGGSSSETTSGIVATTHNGVLSGKVEAGSMLLLYDVNYNPINSDGYADTIRLNTTAENFRFTPPEEHQYFNLIAEKTTGEMLILQQLPGGAPTAKSFQGAFSATGTIAGTIDAPKPSTDNQLYLPGTPYILEGNFSQENLSTSFLIEEIPAGVYTLARHSDTLNHTVDEKKIQITVFPDSLTEWTHERKLK